MGKPQNRRVGHNDKTAKVVPLFGKETKTTHIEEISNGDIAVFFVTDYHNHQECERPMLMGQAIHTILQNYGLGAVSWHVTGVNREPPYIQIMTIYIESFDPKYKDDIMDLLDIFIKHQPYIQSDYILDHADGYDFKENPNAVIHFDNGQSKYHADYLQFKIDHADNYRF